MMKDRNLTKEFEALRSGFMARRGPRLRRRHENLYPNQYPKNDVESQTFLDQSPRFTSSAKTANRLLSDISALLGVLREKHKNRLLVSFDNTETRKEQEIQNISSDITEKIRQCEKIIKTEIASAETTGVNAIVCSNVKKSLGQKLKQVSLKFRASQKEYLQALRQQNSNDVDILGIEQNQSFGTYNFDPGMGQQQFEQINRTSRTEEIRQIAENITEIGVLFQDMASLVVEQGTVLDRIDYNLENVQLRTEKGLQELKIADEYSKNSRTFKCIMILLGIIVLETLVLFAQN